MEQHKSEITLSKLYKSKQFQNVAYTALSNLFEINFQKILKKAHELRCCLIDPAILRESSIRELVIEHGYAFETLEDLKACLDKLKYWDTGYDEVDCRKGKCQCFQTK